MPNLTLESLQAVIVDDVRRALNEDVGDGDITASLIPANNQASASI
ncbi:MAG: nicotinate-nucleotide diphosphorylase (carboxylating), partial [Pseudomonas neustonica]